MFKIVFHCLVFAVKIEIIQTYSLLKTEGQPIENATKKSYKKKIKLFAPVYLIRPQSILNNPAKGLRYWLFRNAISAEIKKKSKTKQKQKLVRRKES